MHEVPTHLCILWWCWTSSLKCECLKRLQQIRACTVSTWSDKILWFEVNVEDPDDDYTDDDDYFDPEDWDKMVENNEDTQSLFEIKVEDMKTAIHDVRMKVGKMRHFQFMRGGSMSKDTHQVESNLSRLNFWSLAHLLLMLIVGVSQVYLVRQLFDEKSMVQKMSARA